MSTSYKVRVYSLEPRKNKQGEVTSYRLRWQVDDKVCQEHFKLRAQGDGFRSDLVSAQRRGEPFDTTTGLPPSMTRASTDMTWFALTCAYVDMKWPDLAATTRQTTAEALIRVLPVFVPRQAGEAGR